MHEVENMTMNATGIRVTLSQSLVPDLSNLMFGSNF